MSKVLVFGGTRFFGRQLVNVLISKGHDVTIATRGITADDFGNRINRIIVDREKIEALEAVFNDKSFDIIYDNICYSSNSAKNTCEVFRGKVGKYIFTSTLSVYDEGYNLKEESFDPYSYEIKYGERKEFSYGEGKRLAEAVFFQKATFPLIAVRFPVVIGKDDYTKRLRSYADSIYKEQSLFISNLESQMSFITSEEAGEFLHWISNKDFVGPINACCNGVIKIKEIIELSEKRVNKKWISSEVDRGNPGAYNDFLEYTLDNSRARELGFKFKNVGEETKRILLV